MKKITSVLTLSACTFGLLFLACSEDLASGVSNGISGLQNNNLDICNYKNEGNVKFSTHDNIFYVCHNGDWIKKDDISSSSTQNTGSSSSLNSLPESSSSFTSNLPESIGTLSELIANFSCSEETQCQKVLISEINAYVRCDKGMWTTNESTINCPENPIVSSSSNAIPSSSSNAIPSSSSNAIPSSSSNAIPSSSSNAIPSSSSNAIPSSSSNAIPSSSSNAIPSSSSNAIPSSSSNAIPSSSSNAIPSSSSNAIPSSSSNAIPSSSSNAIPSSSSNAIPSSSSNVTPSTSSSSIAKICTEDDIVYKEDSQKYFQCHENQWIQIEDQHWFDITITGKLSQTITAGNYIEPIKISGYRLTPNRQTWNIFAIETSSQNGVYTISGLIPNYFSSGFYTETWIIDNKEFVLELKVLAGSSSSTEQSSSSKQSSSSTVSSSSTSSSSVSSSSTITAICPTIKYVTGGMSGSGHASRYWDCCKPSCSWPNNANQGSGKVAKQCKFNSTTTETNPNSQSACDAKGSGAMTCISQTAFTVDGCDNIGFAYAATPGNNSCGKCFELTFTGKGKYETKLNHQKLLGKKLIVMATNIGGDVASGQFDVMIPGGGFGIFNGCDGLNGWKDMNSIDRYGGLLSECEKEAGYSGSDATIYEKRKSCLQKKCGEYFFGDPQAKSGCLFLANFMEAAGNPLHTYKEVECPQVLLNGY